MKKLIITIFAIIPFLAIAQNVNKKDSIGVKIYSDTIIIKDKKTIDSLPILISEKEIGEIKTDSVFILLNKKESINKNKGFFPTLFKMKKVKVKDVDSLPLFTEKPIISYNNKNNNVDKWGKGRSWAIGVQLGTDIGGAIPVPFRYIPKTFNPYPKLNVSIGARGSWSFNDRWSLHAETTYKRVYMGADARVDDQKNTINGVVSYFSGTAYMEMDFTMIEVPLYAKMAITKNYNDFLIIGGYYSYNLKAKFITTPLIGYTGNNPGHVGVVISPDGEPIPMNFNEYLTKHDAGIILGYERRIWGRVNIGLRVMIGCMDIFKSNMKVLEYKMLHMRGVVNLEYDLFLLK